MSLTHLSQIEKNKLNKVFKLHEEKAELVTTDTFLCLEDDMEPPPLAVMRLMELLEKLPEAGIVSSIYCYRCPNIHKMGIAAAQEIVMDNEKIIKKVCCDPDLKGIHEVKACGFGCYAARTKQYLEAFDIIRTMDLKNTVIGNDMLISSVLRLLGWKIFVDFDLWVGHMQITPEGIYTYTHKDAVQDCYEWDDREKVYKYKFLK